MLLDNPTLAGIVQGKIRVVFRTWKRPTVKAGGQLRTRMGLLAIEAVDAIEPGEVSDRDIKLAGFENRTTWVESMRDRTGTLYRIRVRHAGEDPRIALRSTKLGATDIPKLRERLARMDKASETGAWTLAYLEMIQARPAQRAPELAELFGLETKPFKQRVRRLKELGLTESLKVGYRLSPRGLSLLKHLSKPARDAVSRARG
jgi:hypothetical protein